MLQGEHGHVIIPRAPLVLRDDPTTLFTGSGMQPLLPYLLGAEHPAAAASATCSRACARRTWTTSATTGTPRSSRCSATGASATTPSRTDPDAVEVPHRDASACPERIFVSCFIGDPAHGIPRDDESADIWSDLFRAAGDQPRARRPRHRGARRRGRQPGRADRLLRYEELVEPLRRARGHADRRPRRAGLRGVLSLPAGRRTTPPSALSRTRTPTAASTWRSATRCSCSTAPRTGSPSSPHLNVDFGGGLERIAAASIDIPTSTGSTCCGRSWSSPGIALGQDLRRGDHGDAGGHRPHARCGAAGVGRRAARELKTQAYVMRRLVRRGLRYALELELTGGLAEKLVPVIAAFTSTCTPRSRDQPTTSSRC